MYHLDQSSVLLYGASQSFPKKLTRGPPDSAIAKYPLSLTEISETWEIYSARSVTISSELSKIRISLFSFGSYEAVISLSIVCFSLELYRAIATPNNPAQKAPAYYQQGGQAEVIQLMHRTSEFKKTSTWSSNTSLIVSFSKAPKCWKAKQNLSCKISCTEHQNLRKLQSLMMETVLKFPIVSCWKRETISNSRPERCQNGAQRHVINPTHYHYLIPCTLLSYIVHITIIAAFSLLTGCHDWQLAV